MMSAYAASVLRLVLGLYGLTVAACAHAVAPRRGARWAPRPQVGATARIGAQTRLVVHLEAPLGQDTAVHLALSAREMRTALWDVALGLPVLKQAYQMDLQQSFISRTSGAWQLRLGAWPYSGSGAPAKRRRRTGLFAPQHVSPDPFGLVLTRRAHPEQARSQAVHLRWGTFITAAPSRAWAWRGDAWHAAASCRTSRDCPAQQTCSAAHRCMARHGQTSDGVHVAAYRLDDGVQVDVLTFDALQPVRGGLLQVRLDAEHRHMRAMRAGGSVLTRGRQVQHKQVRGHWALGLLWGDAAQLDDALRGRGLTHGGALRLRRVVHRGAPVLHFDYAQQLHTRLFVSAKLGAHAAHAAGTRRSAKARLRLELRLTPRSVLWALSDATLGDYRFGYIPPAAFALGISRSPQRRAGGLGGRMQLRGVRHAPAAHARAKAALHAECLVSMDWRGGALGSTSLRVQLRGQSAVAGAGLRLRLMPELVWQHRRGLWQLQAAAPWQLCGAAAAGAPRRWVDAAWLVRKRRWAGRLETRIATEGSRLARLEHLAISVSLTL